MAQLSIRINDSLAERVESFADSHGVSKSEVFRFAIEQGFFDLEVCSGCNDEFSLKAVMSALFLSTDAPCIGHLLNT